MLYVARNLKFLHLGSWWLLDRWVVFGFCIARFKRYEKSLGFRPYYSMGWCTQWFSVEHVSWVLYALRSFGLLQALRPDDIVARYWLILASYKFHGGFPSFSVFISGLHTSSYTTVIDLYKL